MLKKHRPETSVHIVWGGIAVLALISAAILKNIPGVFPHCLFHSLTGYPCPTCGTVRSITSMAGFDFISALFYNPLIPLLIVGSLVTSIYYGAAHLLRRNLIIEFKSAEKKTIRLLVLALFLANWAYLVAAGI